ncbi:hypothetical protein KIN20_037983 [Parelaphostrongylus tenuis]|uniref:DH domain-containing protein n=1 Tax=Parelaphostrongylus tenuis TaxID=148309 RepID=A0AAD5RET0_PARTN|nr:hypothetical protein KIN20_037983 [Parelaphostrongylus tenuis]
MNTYETARDLLAAADVANQRSHACLRSKECSKEFKKNTFKDLLIRPAQRIPTLIVLLKELEKKSMKKADKIKEAIVLMDKVVVRFNDVRTQNDNLIKQLSFFNDVEELPQYLVCSKRRLLMSVEVFSICGTQHWHSLRRRRVKIFLFNDVIMVCKVRSSYEKTGMLNRMAAHASFPSFSEQRKQYKYFTHLMIQHVREMNQLKRSFYSGAVNERPETSGGDGDPIRKPISHTFCSGTSMEASSLKNPFEQNSTAPAMAMAEKSVCEVFAALDYSDKEN